MRSWVAVSKMPAWGSVPTPTVRVSDWPERDDVDRGERERLSPRRTLVEEGVARTGLEHAGLDDERVHRLDLDLGTGDELVRWVRWSSPVTL